MKFADLTTLNIGGPVEEVIEVKNSEELIQAIKRLMTSDKRYLVIGGGSNLLVLDEGFDGIVVKNEIKGIKRDGNNLTVKSGTLLQDLVNFANKSGLGGLESLAGIPGTIGGAVYGNAGAYGQTISDHLVSVKVFDAISRLPLRGPTAVSKDDCQFSYRDSIFKKTQSIVLEATLSLTPSDSTQLIETSRETIKKREVKYPPGIKCPGSFFKNIPAEKLPQDLLDKIPKEFILYNKVSSGALLESVGAKGARKGKILIAPYHANLFINEGKGTAQDFYDLAREYQERVYDKYGIKLEPEVQLINLPSL